MELASIVIANAAREGKKIPDDVWGSLPQISGLTFNKGSFVSDGLDIIFSASLTAPNGGSKEVWARVGTVPDAGQALSLERKLFQDIRRASRMGCNTVAVIRALAVDGHMLGKDSHHAGEASLGKK